MNALSIQRGASAHSVYALNSPFDDRQETHTLAVLVDNEAGVLARVIGLFSGRGYNIESLTVSETEHEKHLSRITIVTRGTPHVLEQIRHQLERIVPVHRVVDLTVLAEELGRGLARLHARGCAEVGERVEFSHDQALLFLPLSAATSSDSGCWAMCGCSAPA